MENKSKRIAKNTGYLYIRMILQLVVGLYTSRVVLSALGVDDFGIYGVVGGVVSLLGFIKNSMSTATQRFLNFEMGKTSADRSVPDVFITAKRVHWVIALAILILAETIGNWYVLTKLVVSPERLNAAMLCFQFSVFTTIVNIVSVPYNALIIAHERMKAFAYISLIEVFVSLGIAIVCDHATIDRLILYGFLLMVLHIGIRLIYTSYCKRNFEEAKAKGNVNKELFIKIFKFAFWIANGSFAVVAYNQGLNILLNLFFGPAVNASRSIASHIHSKVIQFSSNFQVAVKPQITQSYASGDFKYLHNLIINSSKFSVFLLSLFSIPLIIETDFILNVWLKEVPDYAVTFVQLSLLVGIVEGLKEPLNTAIHATGRIKKFQIYEGGTLLLIVPVAYAVLKMGGDPNSVFFYLCTVGIQRQ